MFVVPGALLPSFVTLANLESKAPDTVRDGNERVIRPRLADAAFFWDNDRRKALSTRREALRDVVYKRGLGRRYVFSVKTIHWRLNLRLKEIRCRK
jgi:glycyl-tRNA synthetase beta chain